ncbi:hypothetical protein JXH92_003660 [Salmonella enterica subsp. enterica serovar 4,[5],12:b:-]|nr:hypothetical protein [Salmonella enterica subsp. enterica serovar 4,[5],12:b:-]
MAFEAKKSLQNLATYKRQLVKWGIFTQAEVDRMSDSENQKHYKAELKKRKER